MSVLPNTIKILEDIVLPSGFPGKAALYSISSVGAPFQSTAGCNSSLIRSPEIIDAIIRVVVDTDYRLQQMAVEKGVIKPGSELAPKYAMELLNDPKDPDFEGYSVMTAVLASKKVTSGLRAIGMVRPGVGRLKDGTPYVRLFFGPIVDKDFRNAKIEGASIDDYLMNAAFDRVEPITGENPMAFVDNQCGLSIPKLRQYGFGVLIHNAGVPGLDAEGPALYHSNMKVTFLAKPNDGSNILPLDVAQQMARSHMELGYGVPRTARLIRTVEDRLAANALNGRIVLS